MNAYKEGNSAYRAFAAGQALALAPGTYAAQPCVTDDTGKQGQDHCQLELLAEQAGKTSWSAGADTTFLAAPLCAARSFAAALDSISDSTQGRFP